MAGPTDHFPFFVTPLLVLGVVLGASVMVYVALTRRWASHRLWVELQDWAREHEYQLCRLENAKLPEPLSGLGKLHPSPRWMLTSKTTTLVQLQSAMEQSSNVEPPAASNVEPVQWNVLIRKRATERAPVATTGLRPATQRQSLLDLFSLSSYPNLATNERFVVYGSESSAARKLGDSGAITLLPPDIGLLLHGEYLLLDFSERPFDPIEFGRMLAVADQLVRVV